MSTNWPVVFVSSHVLFRQLADEAVLLDLEAGQYFGLNSVGARVWQLLMDGHQLSAVFTTLVAEYAVAPDILARDLEELIADLLQAGLLTARPEAESLPPAAAREIVGRP